MFPNAYPLELFHTACSAIGVAVNCFTWLVAKTDLRYAEIAEPYSGDRVRAGMTRVRRERVSLVYVQGLMLCLGLMSLYYPPPPWPWDLQGITLPWNELNQSQRAAKLFAWLWRLGICVMCLRKAANSLQNWFDERPLRRPLGRRHDDAQPRTTAERAEAVAAGTQTVAARAGVVAREAEEAAECARSDSDREPAA